MPVVRVVQRELSAVALQLAPVREPRVATFEPMRAAVRKLVAVVRL